MLIFGVEAFHNIFELHRKFNCIANICCGKYATLTYRLFIWHRYADANLINRSGVDQIWGVAPDNFQLVSFNLLKIIRSTYLPWILFIEYLFVRRKAPPSIKPNFDELRIDQTSRSPELTREYQKRVVVKLVRWTARDNNTNNTNKRLWSCI